MLNSFMKTFVIGDIHGAYTALVQCLERSGFDYKQDRLIVLGDVCDGYPEVKQCIDELLKIEHCDYIIGNHDVWVLDWALLVGWQESLWLDQGGRSTIASYGGKPMPKEHVQFLKDAHLWLELEDKVFVHAGFNPQKPISTHDRMDLVWDRTLIEQAYRMNRFHPGHQFSQFKEIYLGHTTTENFGSVKPLKLCNVWALDTGAGWSGCLTIMDVNTKQYWQSDFTPQLYPNANSRG